MITRCGLAHPYEEVIEDSSKSDDKEICLSRKEGRGGGEEGDDNNDVLDGDESQMNPIPLFISVRMKPAGPPSPSIYLHNLHILHKALLDYSRQDDPTYGDDIIIVCVVYIYLMFLFVNIYICVCVFYCVFFFL
jgi:hypothetical protein